jgi:hypothetical protein
LSGLAAEALSSWWPRSCSDSIVSAVAVPVGKGSFSMLMSWRLIGIAVNTPRREITANQKNIDHGSGRIPVNINRAGTAAMLPPPVMKPAAEATEPIALFSSFVNSLFVRRRCAGG